MFKDIRTIFSSFTATIVAVFTTTEKMVHLVENEVDNLEQEQKLRFDEIVMERAEAQAAKTKESLEAS